MASVIDSQTGQAVEVPDAHVGDLWKAGRIQLTPGASYHVLAQDGRFYQVPAEQMAEALGKGASTVDPTQAQDSAEARSVYGAKGMAMAGAHGFASQATLGLSDELLHGTDLGTSLETASKHHEIAHGIGEAAGAVALTAATGLGGAAEEGAALGLRAVGGLGESTLGRIGARAALTGARGLAEGAQMGVAHAISNDALTDHEQSAQDALAIMGGDTLWGGLLGAGFGAVGGAFSKGAAKAAEAVEPGATKLEQALSAGKGTDADVGALVGKAAGIDAPTGDAIGTWRQSAERLWAKASAAATGKDEATIGKAIGGLLDGAEGSEARRMVREAPALRDQAKRDLTATIDELLAAHKDVSEEAMGDLKRSHVASAVADVDPATAAQASRQVADDVLTKLNAMAQEPETFGNAGSLKKILKAAEIRSAALDEHIAGGKVADQFLELDGLKRDVGKLATRARKALGSGANAFEQEQNRAFFDAMSEMYRGDNGLQRALEDETVWGKAGADQKAINEPFSRNINSSKLFQRQFTEMVGQDLDAFGREIYGASPSKVGSYISGLINPDKDLAHQSIRDYFASSKDLADAIKAAYPLGEQEAAKVARLKDAAAKAEGILAKQTEVLQTVNQFERLRNATTMPGAVPLGATLGAMAGGPIGAVIGGSLGKVADAILNPARVAEQMGTLEHWGRRVQARIGSGLSGFARGAKRAAPAADASSYARKAAQVARATSQPDAVATRIGMNLGNLRANAPKLSDALTTTTLAGLQLLQAKLPPQRMADPLDPKAKPPLPPPNVREAWLRYHDAVRDPISVVENLRDGRLSPEGIEVLQTVYPKLFSRVQTQIAEQIAAGKLADLDHQQRIGLGLLMQMPTDPTLDPGYIAQRQAAYLSAGAGEAEGARNGASTGGPKRPVNLEKAAPATTVDRIEARNSQGG